MSLGTAAIYSVLGMAIVFFALILLMLMTKIMAKLIPSSETKVETAKAPSSTALAPGSAGDFKLNGVEPKDAAMCMAIIADQLKKPLNELRFISIKEVEK